MSSSPPTSKTRHKRTQEAHTHARVGLRGELTVDDPAALLRALADELDAGTLSVADLRYERREWTYTTPDPADERYVVVTPGQGPSVIIRFRHRPRE